MKQLSRKKIQDMIDLNGVNISSRRSSGGSGAGGGGGVSSAWVDEHYVSKDFFARLFTINGTDENDDDVVVEPNDLETTITNIQAMVGLWTEEYLSALGQGSGGGGGGGAILTEPLASINEAGMGTPSGANKVIVWNGSTWTYMPYTTGSGTVTSVTMTVPTGFKVSNGDTKTINTTGSFDLTFGGTITKNQVLASPAAANGTPAWRALVADDIPTLTAAKISDITLTDGTLTIGNNSITPITDATLKSDYSWWGGKLDATTKKREGNMSNVGNISFSDTGKNIGSVAYFDTTNHRLGIGSSPGAYKLDVNGDIRTSGNLYIGGTNRILSGSGDSAKNLLEFDGTQVTLAYGFRASNETRIYGQNISMYHGSTLKVQVTSTGLKIGDATLSWDSTNHALKIDTGFYSESFISALGAGSGGGSGMSLEQPLSGINSAGLSAPTVSGSVLVYSNNVWKYSSSANILAMGISIAGTASAAGFSATGKDNTYVLLGGGGTSKLKTINGNSIFGDGDIVIPGGGSNDRLMPVSVPLGVQSIYAMIGQPTIGTAAGNAYGGSSSNANLWSYPVGGTGENSTVANIQNIRIYWGATYFTDFFTSPNNNHIFHRNVQEGTAGDWYVIPQYKYIQSSFGLGSATKPVYIDSNGKLVEANSYPSTLDNIADGTTRKLANYLPINTAGGIAIVTGGGQNWWCKIATIKITSAYINRPIVFELSQRGYEFSVVQVMFNSDSGTDPSLKSFTTNNANVYYIKKSTTSTWEIYGKYSESWGDCTLHRVTGCGADIGVTINMTNAGTSDPSDLTQCTYSGSVATASKLTTSRNIWGRPFNGTGDVSGDMTGVGNVSATGKITIYDVIGDTYASDYGSLRIKSTTGSSPYMIGLAVCSSGFGEVQASRQDVGNIPLILQKMGGNVGIGTRNPAYALDVNGDVRATNFRGALVGNASTATSATTASSCTGNAATATTAASCSGNAATATTAASCSGNAATATKLQNDRTIWGQTFSGSGNVSGRLSLVASDIYWKEAGFGDQFSIVPYFSGSDDQNILCFKSATGGSGTSPDLSTKMVIAGYSGNVGIGTTSAPLYKLHVNGTFYASGNSSIGGTLAVGGPEISCAGNLRIHQSANNLYLGRSNNSGWVYLADTASQSGSSNWAILNNGRAKFQRIWLYKPDADYSTNNGVYIEYDINSGGIHIAGGGLYADTYLSALGAGSGGGSGSGITMADVWSAMATPAPSTAQEQIEASHLSQALSGYASKTWVQNRGYLTSNEAVTLSTAQTISAAKIFGAGLKSYSICIETKIDGTADTNRSGEINRYGSDLRLQYHNQTGYTSGGITMCNNGGSVAIGYSSQDSNYKLKVNGKVRISDQIGVNADVASDAQCMLNINGTAKSLAWNSGSDIRLKDVINPVTASVEDIANVRIFDFRWKKDGENGKIHFGSAAQDWQPIFPHAVVADKEGFLSMDYGGIAVGAVKTVAQEVVLLKKRVAELEKQLKAS